MTTISREVFHSVTRLTSVLATTPRLHFGEMVSVKVRIPAHYVSTTLTAFAADVDGNRNYARVADQDGILVAPAIPDGHKKTFVNTNVNTTTDTITVTSHGYQNEEEIALTTTGTLPAPLATGTLYYIINAAANTFKLTTVKADAAKVVDITDQGSAGATHTVQSSRWMTLPASLIACGAVRLVTDSDDSTKDIEIIKQG